MECQEEIRTFEEIEAEIISLIDEMAESLSEAQFWGIINAVYETHKQKSPP